MLDEESYYEQKNNLSHSIIDNIMWDFFEEDMDFASFTEEYKMIAEGIIYLLLPSRRSYSPDEIVDLIQTVTSIFATNYLGDKHVPQRNFIHF